MFEKFTSKDAQDFNQRYRGTFGYFTRRGVKTLVQINSVGQTGVSFLDKDGLQYLLKPDTEDDSTGFEFLPPKCAYHNTTAGIPILVRRIAAKQYSRGICEKNTGITTVDGMSYPVDFTTLGLVYNSNVNVKAAYDRMLDDMDARIGAPVTGVALSNSFAYSPRTMVLKCFNMIIGRGTVTREKGFNLVLEKPDIWRQEVTDALRRNNLKGKVV